MQGNNEVPADSGKAKDEREYTDLLILEAMESLLEELEDMGITGSLQADALPDDLAELVRSLNMQSTNDLKTRIRALHSTLDRKESE
jgi:hypothetical protein